jgi:hypothetical protein
MLLHINNLMFFKWIPCAWPPSTRKSIVGPFSSLPWVMESKLILLPSCLISFHVKSLYLMQINMKIGWMFSGSNVWKTLQNKTLTNTCVVMWSVCRYVKHWVHLLYRMLACPFSSIFFRGPISTKCLLNWIVKYNFVLPHWNPIGLWTKKQAKESWLVLSRLQCFKIVHNYCIVHPFTKVNPILYWGINVLMEFVFFPF